LYFLLIFNRNYYLINLFISYCYIKSAQRSKTLKKGGGLRTYRTSGALLKLGDNLEIFGDEK